MSQSMRFYCPDEGCSRELTDLVRDPKNFVSLPGRFYAGVFCVGCGKVVMPTANKELYWKSGSLENVPQNPAFTRENSMGRGSQDAVHSRSSL
jgi:hypothetical protein